MKSTKLSIFNRFKTGSGELTGEAKRQRRIIMALVMTGASPSDRTRTGIAQKIAKIENTTWKNIYSGIFRDLDEVLLPACIVKEEGRLPLRRGPKALQEMGVPYYMLTREGKLVAAALVKESSERTHLLDDFFADAAPDEKEFSEILVLLSESSPIFAAYLIRQYVRAFCDGTMENLLPFDVARIRGEVQDEVLQMQKEFAMAACEKFTKDERDEALRLLERITSDNDNSDEDGDIKPAENNIKKDKE